MDMASPISNSNERRRSLRQSSRQLNHKLNSENTNGYTEVRSNGRENIGCENVTMQPDHEGNLNLNAFIEKMDMASSISNSNERRRSLRQSSRQHNHKLNSENTNGSTDVRSNGPENIGCENVAMQPDHEGNFLPTSIIIGMNNEAANSATKSASKQKKVVEAPKSATKSASKRKKVVSRLKSNRYPLRSSLSSGRVLRSMSNEKCKTQPDPVNTTVNPATKQRKKRGEVKKDSNDEYSVIRKRGKYLLTRMNYEQTFIDAYSGEGWRGQSAEKIRPEKELERAKSEILRCKFKIRELFQHIDSLSSEGRFVESLFDSEGEIDSEDIFCCKCGSKEVSADNDIILCDGICDRGFHQKCLMPPLLSEDIPIGDEGWLCPACDCKADCIELLDEFQGSNISIDDTWEKVFPEAVAIANGDKQYDDLPSDDSEDHDFNPDGPEVDADDHEEETDTEESGSTSASEANSDASDSNKSNKKFGFPSDDSEDDDFDPDAPGLDNSTPKDGSSSDESDFTSDYDEFCNELSKTSGAHDDSASSLHNQKHIVQSGEGTLVGVLNNSVHTLLEPDLNQENILDSGRRQFERLDYKELHDVTYGKSSSDSSDDEDWSESADMSTPNKGKKYVPRKESRGPADIHHLQTCQDVDESTPRKTHTALGASGMEHDSTERYYSQQEPNSNGNKSSTSARKRLSEIATQKLHEYFQETQYPTREKKESIAQEIGLTYRQVDKWFGNLRHCLRVSAKQASPNGVQSPNKGTTTVNGESARSSDEPDGSAAQSPGSKGVKRKKNTSASKQPQGGADHGEDAGDGVDGSAAQSPGSKGVKRKKNTSAAKQPQVGADHGEDAGDGVDEDRQKAIARELRKMKQRR